MGPVTLILVLSGVSCCAVLLLATGEYLSQRKYRGGGNDGLRRMPAPPKPAPGGAANLPTCLVPNAQWRSATLPSTTSAGVGELV